jgi:DNA-binding CsgD family transcriptional regulator/tetratricopeptide (TPR) repeat protein
MFSAEAGRPAAMGCGRTRRLAVPENIELLRQCAVRLAPMVAVSPFVGRTDELGALLGTVQRTVRDGRPVAAVVVGDPGSGKSRLLAEVVARVDIEPKLRLGGYEAERQVPFAGASDLLRTLAQSPGTEARRLRSLLYEQSTHDAGLEPLRVFEAAHRCLRDVGPTLLSVDDLHWVDDRTLALCHYLIRAASVAGQPMGTIIVSRPARAVAALSDSLRDVFASSPDFVELVLGPLSHEESVRLAIEIAPELTPERAEALVERAGRFPYWVEALARSGGEELDARQVVTARLRGVSLDAASLLALLVVAARPLSIGDAGAVLAWSAERISEAAAQLVNRGVVVQAGPALRLAHDLIREAVERDLGREDRQRLHRRLAVWLEEDTVDDVQVLRAALQHRHDGAMPAVGLALRLARSSRRSLLGSEGLRDLARIADESHPDDHAALELQNAVAELASEVGEWPLAFERWAMLSERLVTPSERARAALEAAKTLSELRRASEAFSYLERCRTLDPNDPLLAIEADALEAYVLGWLAHETGRARVPAFRSLTAARRLVDVTGRIDALETPVRQAYLAAVRAWFDVALWHEDVPDMLAASDELVEAARNFGDAHMRATLDLPYLLWQLGRWREAETRFRRVLAEARERVLPTVVAEAAFHLAYVLFPVGRIDEASALAQEAVGLAERQVLPKRYFRSEVRNLSYLIAASQADWRGALDRVAHELAGEADPHARTVPRIALADWLARFGGAAVADEVKATLAAARSDTEAADCDRCRSEFVVRAVASYARVGCVEEARAAAARFDAEHPKPDPWPALLRRHGEALLTARSGEVPRSIALFEAAEADASAMGLLLEALWVQLDLGEALSSIDRQRAVGALERGIDLAISAGSQSAQARAEQLLRALGVRTWRRGTRSEPLSERELEIARLVAQGASNPEIAQGLFLSRKTVERHVSNLLNKLDARNRAELASRLAKDGIVENGEGVHR